MNPTNSPRQKLPGVYTLVERGWQFYKKNFKKLWPLFLLGGIGSTSLRFSSSSHSSSSVTSYADQFHVGTPLIVVGVVIIVALLLFFFLSKIALFKSISDTHKNQFVSVKDSYKKSLRLFWPFVLVSLITVAATIGAYVLFIIPGIILGGYLLLTTYEFIDQDKRSFVAILGSWALVKGYWWSIVWRFAVISLVIAIITFGGVLAVLIPGIILVFLGVYLKMTWFVVTVVVIGALLMAVFAFLVMTPLSILSAFELYYAVKSARASETFASPIDDKKRTRKIIGAIVIGCIGIVAFVIGMRYLIRNVLPNLTTSSSFDASSVIHPRGKMFTFEDIGDMYTIDYPSTWQVTGESVRATPGYEREVSFSPLSDMYKKNNVATTTIYIKTGIAGDDLNTLDKMKKTILSMLVDSQYTRISSLEATTSYVGSIPAVTFSYILNDIQPSSATSTGISTQSGVLIKAFLKGNEFFFFSYSADTTKYLSNLPIVNDMLDSWYLYYSEPKIGESYQYVNKDYGISLVYPKDWVQVGAQPEYGLITQAVKPEFADGYLKSDSSISVYVGNYPSSLDAYKKLMVAGKFNGSGDLKNFKATQVLSTKLGGFDAYRVDYVFDGVQTDGVNSASSTGTMLFTVQNKKVYQLSFHKIKPADPVIEQTIPTFTIEAPQVQVPENRQFGYSMTVPNLWPDDGLKDDFANSIVQGYALPNISPLLYKGSLSIGIPDDYYVNDPHFTIDQYRDISLKSWRKGTEAIHDFKLLETGTTTVSGLPAAYFVGTYPGTYDVTGQIGSLLKAKQYFVSNNGVVRWITYIDDEKDFDFYISEVDHVVNTFKPR